MGPEGSPHAQFVAVLIKTSPVRQGSPILIAVMDPLETVSAVAAVIE
jgi:hypothetical protein